jgi:hypothetical protein
MQKKQWRLPTAHQTGAARGSRITLKAMDRVRFGRALGYGARHAAKTVIQAVDAATTPSVPSATPASPEARVGSRVAAAPEAVRRASAHTRDTAKTTWSPLAKFSSVLWLQVTGSFFLLLAAFFAQGLWKARTAIHLSLHSREAEKFYVYAAAFAAFAYFGVSNFVRARRRERR